MPAMRERVTVGNRTLSYLEAEGQVTAPRKARVAVLIHGFPLNAEMWQPQLAAVPDGWRFIALGSSRFCRKRSGGTSRGGAGVSGH